VPMTTGRLRIDTAQRRRSPSLWSDTRIARIAPVEHDVISVNPYELTFLQIEVKR